VIIFPRHIVVLKKEEAKVISIPKIMLLMSFPKKDILKMIGKLKEGA